MKRLKPSKFDDVVYLVDIELGICTHEALPMGFLIAWMLQLP